MYKGFTSVSYGKEMIANGTRKEKSINRYFRYGKTVQCYLNTRLLVFYIFMSILCYQQLSPHIKLIVDSYFMWVGFSRVRMHTSRRVYDSLIGKLSCNLVSYVLFQGIFEWNNLNYDTRLTIMLLIPFLPHSFFGGKRLWILDTRWWS